MSSDCFVFAKGSFSKQSWHSCFSRHRLHPLVEVGQGTSHRACWGDAVSVLVVDHKYQNISVIPCDLAKHRKASIDTKIEFVQRSSVHCPP